MQSRRSRCAYHKGLRQYPPTSVPLTSHPHIQPRTFLAVTSDQSKVTEKRGLAGIASSDDHQLFVSANYCHSQRDKSHHRGTRRPIIAIVERAVSNQEHTQLVREAKEKQPRRKKKREALIVLTGIQKTRSSSPVSHSHLHKSERAHTH